jgi:hypothetical protein
MKKIAPYLLALFLFGFFFTLDWGDARRAPPIIIPDDLSSVVITLERTPCFGTCPAYRVTVHGDGEVTYEGEMFVEVTGTETYQIPEADVRELVSAFVSLNFFSLDDEYVSRATDLPSTTTSITLGDTTKTVFRYGEGPGTLVQLENRIDELAQTKDLTGR